MLPSQIQAYVRMRQNVDRTMSYRQFNEGEQRVSRSGRKRPASPDPVLLVRQYEEDERMAKLMQENENAPPHVSAGLDLHIAEMQAVDSQLQEIFGDDVVSALSESCIMDIRSQERIINSLAESTVAASESWVEGDVARYIDEGPDEDIDDDEDDYDDDEFGDEDYSDEAGEMYSEGIAGGQADPCECPRGLRTSELERLPTTSIHSSSPPKKKKKKKQGESSSSSSSQKSCQVCLETYGPGDKLRYLPCFHDFHKSCIDPWLKKSNTCPVCRVKVDVKELQ